MRPAGRSTQPPCPRSSLHLLIAGLQGAERSCSSHRRHLSEPGQEGRQEAARRPGDSRGAEGRSTNLRSREGLFGARGWVRSPSRWSSTSSACLWRDDLSTTYHHLDLSTVRMPGRPSPGDLSLRRSSGDIDPKTTNTLNGHVHTCSINPNGRRRARQRHRAAPPTANLYQCSADGSLSCTDVQNDCLDFPRTILLLCCCFP